MNRISMMALLAAGLTPLAATAQQDLQANALQKLMLFRSDPAPKKWTGQAATRSMSAGERKPIPECGRLWLYNRTTQDPQDPDLR